MRTDDGAEGGPARRSGDALQGDRTAKTDRIVRPRRPVRLDPLDGLSQARRREILLRLVERRRETLHFEILDAPVAALKRRCAQETPWQQRPAPRRARRSIA